MALQPDPSTSIERYSEIGYAIAERWADRNQHDGDPEYRMVAAVIHDLLAQNDNLRTRLTTAEGRALNMESDLLDTLYVWATGSERDEHNWPPLHYVARGWRRELSGNRLTLADTVEGKVVSSKLSSDDLGVE